MAQKQDIIAAWRGDHDHLACISDAIARAQQVCAEKGVRLTPLRQRVLELIWQSHKPSGAYELLDVIKLEHESAAPPTVYRALDFLKEHGLVHRIESLNAYVGCNYPNHAHDSIILVCDGCGSASEIEDETVTGSIKTFATDLGFKLSSQSVEAAGLCPSCQN